MNEFLLPAGGGCTLARTEREGVDLGELDLSGYLQRRLEGSICLPRKSSGG